MYMSVNPLYSYQLYIYSDINSPVPFNHVLNCFNIISSDCVIFNKGGYLICP